MVKGSVLDQFVIGRDARIENSELVSSVLLDGVSVGAGCHIENAIIMDKVTIPPGTVIDSSYRDRGKEIPGLFVTDSGIVIISSRFQF